MYVDKQPFKSAAYLQRMGATSAPVPTRRNKTLKQILNQERDAYMQKRGLDKKRVGESTPKRRKLQESTAEEVKDEANLPTNDTPTRYIPTCTSHLLT